MKKLLLSILVLTLFASCSDVNDLFDVSCMDEQAEDVTIGISIVPFETNEGARTRASFGSFEDGEEFPFTFKKKDKFGLCSLDGTINASMSLTKDFNVNKTSKSLSLDDKTLSSKLNGKKCVIYFPYDEALFRITGYRFLFYMNQLQLDADNSNYIANYNNFYVSEPFVFSQNQSASGLTLKPYNSVIKLCTSLPDGCYSKIEIVNADNLKVFVDGCGDMSSDCFMFREIPEYEKSTSLPLNLRLPLKEYGISIVDGEEFGCDFYFTTCAKNTGNFYVKATTTDGTVFYSTEVFNPIELKAGHGYVVDCTLNNVPNVKPATNADADTENGIHYVDLFTPNVYWATVNLGAVIPTENGHHYAWGEFIYKDCYMNADAGGYPSYRDNQYSAKTDYNWVQYKWNRDGVFYKYGQKKTSAIVFDYQFPTLKREDDVANKTWGGTWHVPSWYDFVSLCSCCFWKYTSDYMGSGVAGYMVFRSKNRHDEGLMEKDGEFSYIDLTIPELFCGTISNDWKSNPILRKENYDEDEDVHIFLPNLGDEDLLGYMTSNTGLNDNSVEKWNDMYYMLHINEQKGLPDLKKIQVYLGSVIRPVCDRKDGR